jgi:3-methyladenine DNA glycosylase Tag
MPPTEAPEQVKVKSLNDYLDVMSKATFQSGMSWKVVEAKWTGIREAFHGFDVDTVAEMSEDDIDRLTQDTSVIRNRRKLAAVVSNAQRMGELEDEFGTFKKYLRSEADFEATVKSLRKNFKFLGDFGSYYFLYVVGEQVPPHEEFQASRGK